MSNVLNQQTPAFPTVPVADQFGTVHFYPGMTKQEYLAALLFADSFKLIRENFIRGDYESNEDMTADVIHAKHQAFQIADIFFHNKSESKVISMNNE